MTEVGGAVIDSQPVEDEEADKPDPSLLAPDLYLASKENKTDAVLNFL